MKKLFIILLLVIYGFSSSGMTVQLHYCCGKLKSIELFATEKETCGMGHEMGSQPCCETKEVSKQDKSDELNLQLALKLLTAPAVIAKTNIHSNEVALNRVEKLHVTDTSPLLGQHDLFLRNCVFRI